jgi:magnesium-transporting ATPase (P-type)
LQLSGSKGTDAVERFFTYFILLNTMIPISLVVTLEIVKVIQAYFISRDRELYVEAKNRPCEVMTSTINEELG